MRPSLSAQIDCAGRQLRLVEQNYARLRPSEVEYEATVLRAVIDTLAWLRANEPEIRAFVDDRRGARS